MGLNNLKPDANSKFNQGIYIPKFPDKYIGDPTNIVYRSSLERKFCAYCDNNSQIIKWGCETIIIPYNDHNGKPHRYYPDFYIEFANLKNPQILNKYIIEVKPYAETIPPVIPEKLTGKKAESLEYQLKMYRKNMHKWSKAIEWCKNRDIEFKIITENAIKDIFY